LRSVEITVDVGEAAGLGQPAEVRASVILPEPDTLADRPVVAFARPSSSYARGYYTDALPGPGADAGSQADFHARKGWIFVSIDTLGCTGARTIDPEKLGYRALAAAGHAAEREILLRLANGVLAPDYPPVNQPLRLGIGHSLGAAIAIYQQARHASYDGLAVLGFSAVHSHPATPPGGEPVVVAWYPRDAGIEECREPLNAAALPETDNGTDGDAWDAVAWGFHFDDVPRAIVQQDMAHYARVGRSDHAGTDQPPWYAQRTPERAARSTLTPGVVALEAATVAVPVLCAMGVRDLVPDPPGEPKAYRSARSVDVFVAPRMGHVHNMASTRRLLWERIHLFGQWCALVKRQAA